MKKESNAPIRPKVNMPKDRWLIQEALKRVPDGAENFMQWVQANYDQFDPEFFNFLRKLTNYAEQSGDQALLKTFGFLDKCFQKMFAHNSLPPTVATEENYQQLWQQACQYLSKGQVGAALVLFKTLLIFFSLQQKNDFLKPVYSNLGIAHAQLGQPVEAIQCLHKALELTPVDISVDREKILANLGAAYQQKRDYQEALEFHQKALDIARQRNDELFQIEHLSAIAIVEIDRQELVSAIDHQKEALHLAEKLADRRHIVESLTRLAVLYTMTEQPLEAKEYSEKALVYNQEFATE